MKNLLLPLLVCLLIACKQETPEQISGNLPAEKLPNIILIMTDDQGYGDLGCHGNEIIQTPNLDALSKESVRFTNFHVATTCAPTRAGLMSGMHCNRTGTWHTVMGRSFLSNRYMTIADYLKGAGYRTGIFGKWHLGDNYPFRPQDRGFEEVLVHGGGGVGQTPDYWNNDYFDDTYFHNGKAKKFNGFCTDIWFDEAIKYIESGGDKPFFTYITTNAPHGPHHAPQKYIDQYKDNEAVTNPNFYGQITNIDDNIGKLRKSLAESGLSENTIIIFTTDNGTAAGANLDKDQHVVKGYNVGMRGKKGSMYEGGHRVPLFMKFPESMEIEKRSLDELTTYTDILPTMIDFMNVKPSGKYPFDGESIKPLITKGSQLSLNDRIVVVDTQRDELCEKWKKSSVMQGQWRLVNNEELYDLSVDPGQANNIIKKHPEKLVTLAGAYEKWWADFQDEAAEINYIIIGAEIENPSLLTSHDWHSGQTPAWHQQHIRVGKSDNGYWLLDVAKAGNYNFKLHRWPPYLAKAINASLPGGDKVDGGKPYPEGVSINLEKAKIKIQDQEMESGHLINDRYFEFNLNLEVGVTQLQTWMIGKDEVDRGAYFVEAEWME